MKKYKLNKENTSNREPSEDKILKYKNFKVVMEDYQKMTRPPKPLYKNPKVFIALVLLALVAWLVSSEFNEKQKEVEKEKTEKPK